MKTMQLPSDQNRSGRDLGQEELELLREVIESGTLFGPKGTKVRALEREFAALLGLEHCTATSSGTAAIHAALAALRLRPGDEVVTSPVTDMGALTPIVYEGARPVFADLCPRTLNLTAESIRSRLTTKTRAVIVTHLFGNPANLESISALCRDEGLALIEDCAQAFLATWNGRPVGTFGDLACFSMQQGKHITCGEGGLLVARDHDKGGRARLFVHKAWPYGTPSPDHLFMALNYRLSELQAAVALAQLRKLDSNLALRRATAQLFLENLPPGIETVAVDPRAQCSWWRVPLLVDDPVALAGRLATRGVAGSAGYVKPAFVCRCFVEYYDSHGFVPPEKADFPGMVEGLERVLVLPWNERYTDEHVEFLLEALRS